MKRATKLYRRILQSGNAAMIERAYILVALSAKRDPWSNANAFFAFNELINERGN